MDTKQMIDEIRRIIGRTCEAGVPEKAVYEALVDEASGWEMRLEELEGEDE